LIRYHHLYFDKKIQKKWQTSCCIPTYLPLFYTLKDFFSALLLLRGYVNHAERVAIVYGMIEMFNEMIIAVGKEYKNVYHIDSRGAVNEKNGWYNELHPKSHEFKKIAAVFEKCIESKDRNKKVYKVMEEQ